MQVQGRDPDEATAMARELLAQVGSRAARTPPRSCPAGSSSASGSPAPPRCGRRSAARRADLRARPRADRRGARGHPGPRGRALDARDRHPGALRPRRRRPGALPRRRGRRRAGGAGCSPSRARSGPAGSSPGYSTRADPAAGWSRRARLVPPPSGIFVGRPNSGRDDKASSSRVGFRRPPDKNPGGAIDRLAPTSGADMVRWGHHQTERARGAPPWTPPSGSSRPGAGPSPARPGPVRGRLCAERRVRRAVRPPAGDPRARRPGRTATPATKPRSTSSRARPRSGSAGPGVARRRGGGRLRPHPARGPARAGQHQQHGLGEAVVARTDPNERGESVELLPHLDDLAPPSPERALTDRVTPRRRPAAPRARRAWTSVRGVVGPEVAAGSRP